MMRYAERRRPFALTLLAAAVGVLTGLFPLAPVAYAADQPEVTLEWTPPEVLHEYWWGRGSQPQTLTITNNGSATLTLVDAGATNSIAPTNYLTDSVRWYYATDRCATLAPSQTCTVPFEDARVVGDYPGPTTVTITATLRDPTGRVVTGSVAHAIPSIDDLPVAFPFVVEQRDVTAPSPSIEYALSGASSAYVGEPVSLVGLHSELYGDLLDPANPQIRRVSDLHWAATSPPKPGVVYHDRVTSTFADDEGNTTTRDDDLTWDAVPGTQPAFDVKLAVADDAPTLLPAAGGETTLSITATNTGDTTMYLTSLKTSDGRELLDPAASDEADHLRPIEGVTCSVVGPVSAGDQVTCTYPSSTLDAYPGYPASPSIQVTAAFVTANGVVKLIRNASTTLPFAVPPDISVRVTPGTEHGSKQTATTVITNTSAEPVTVSSVTPDTPLTVRKTKCTGPTELKKGESRTCTTTIRFRGDYHDGGPFGVTVVATNKAGDTVTKKASTTLNRG